MASRTMIPRGTRAAIAVLLIAGLLFGASATSYADVASPSEPKPTIQTPPPVPKETCETVAGWKRVDGKLPPVVIRTCN